MHLLIGFAVLLLLIYSPKFRRAIVRSAVVISICVLSYCACQEQAHAQLYIPPAPIYAMLVAEQQIAPRIWLCTYSANGAVVRFEHVDGCPGMMLLH